MKLTNEQKQQIYFLIDKYGTEWFDYNNIEHKMYLGVINNTFFENRLLLVGKNNDLISQYKIRDEFFLKYNRSKKLSSFLSPS
jgi:hypothetical protein